MSINAINGVSQPGQSTDQPAPITPAAGVTPFGQQLDAQGDQADAAHAHHHHPHGGAAQSVTSSAASAASVAGIAPAKSVATSLLNLLS